MAKRVSVAELQAMGRGGSIDDTEIIDPLTEDAAATEALRRIGAPVNGKGQGDDGTIGTPCTACRAYDHVDRPRRMVDGINGVRYQVCDWCDEHGRQADGSLLKAEPIAVTSGHADAVDALIEATAGGRVGEISVTPADGINEPLIDTFEPSIYDHLRALGVERGCTAEMSLHMITERVRDAALTLPAYYAPAETDVVHEAERIWVSLDRKRSHTYSVDQDGTVRDWRRPDTTPDRGDVTVEHTLTDAYAANEPRFSGGGDGEQQATFMVPTAAKFGTAPYLAAPALEEIAARLMANKADFDAHRDLSIIYRWKAKGGNAKGLPKLAGIDRVTGQTLAFIAGPAPDLLVWLAADTLRDSAVTDLQVEAILFDQLAAIEWSDGDEDGDPTWRLVGPEIMCHLATLEEYGPFTRRLLAAKPAFAQPGLFDQLSAPVRGDGSGVLIHASGEPMSADEIEAMERHELEDAPAEDEDILADPAVI